MIFNAEYAHRADKDKPRYWRTVHGDGINEAKAQAEKHVRAGYFLIKVIERV